MEDRRLKLHEILCDILGSRNVYYQPPATVKMNYPAIRYALDNIRNRHADNGVYLSAKRYSVTLIDYDPDSPFVNKIARLPTCRFNRYYAAENLNHYVFVIYF